MELDWMYQEMPSLRERLVWLPETGSTIDVAKDLIRSGKPDAVVIADRQTGGRGRRGRAFYSPPGDGIYLSIALRPLPACVPFAPTVLFAAAAARAIDSVTGQTTQIKWVNDLILGGFKIAGILLEGGAAGIASGIGVNINNPRESFLPQLPHANSLAAICGRRFTVEEVGLALVREVDRAWAGCQTAGDAERELSFYRSRLITVGRAVRVTDGENERLGQAVGLDADAALLVDFGKGPERVVVGDVSVHGAEGYL